MAHDWQWREDAIHRLGDVATLLNPLAGKREETTGQWTQFGSPTTAARIVAQDFAMVDRADIVLADVSSLGRGYPTIGTLMELGRASGRDPRPLVFLVSENALPGANGMFKIHPFLSELAAAIFPSTEAALEYLAGWCEALSGAKPHFAGVCV